MAAPATVARDRHRHRCTVTGITVTDTTVAGLTVTPAVTSTVTPAVR